MEWKRWHILSNRSESSGEWENIRIYSDILEKHPRFIPFSLDEILIGHAIWI